jgi:hypothetical protein
LEVASKPTDKYDSVSASKISTCWGLKYAGAVQLDWQQDIFEDRGDLYFQISIDVEGQRSRSGSRTANMQELNYNQPKEWNTDKGYSDLAQHSTQL